MLAGCCKVDITPPIGTPIGGNVRIDSISRGVHDPLYANVLYLQDQDSGILFIGLDLLGVHRSLANQIKRQIDRFTGIGQERIAVFATHTHSGPDVIEAFKDDYHPLVKTYFEDLREKVIRGAVDCIQNTWKATIGVGKGMEHSLSFNRRIRMKDGSVRMNWEPLEPEMIDGPLGPIDPDVIVVSVMDEHKCVRSVIVNFALHPAVLVGKDWMFSRDFIDSLTGRLEREFGERLVVLFANGALGNVNHIDIHNPKQTRGFEEADRIGTKLAENVLSIMSGMVYAEPMRFCALSETVEVPLRVITNEQTMQARRVLAEAGGKIPSLLDGVPKEAYAKEILALAREAKTHVSTELQIFQWDDAAVVFLPGEFFVEFGLEIKRRSPFSNTCVVGLANDYLGYVPTERAFEEGGYEVQTARTSKLQPVAGPMMVERLLQMLGSL